MRFAASFALVLACSLDTVSAQSSGPAAGFKIDPKYTSTSPDRKTTIEQYAKNNADGYSWQFWARRSNALTLLKPEQPNYSANFTFTNDSRWLVREQKTGSGADTLYLYRLDPRGLFAATPLGELAWTFFRGLDSRKARKPDFHMNAVLLKETDHDYPSVGKNWPDNRYLVISLSGEVLPNNHHGQLTSLLDWRCRYDLQQGKFDVPPDFLVPNAEAITPD
jgi:hypothetical protein